MGEKRHKRVGGEGEEKSQKLGREKDVKRLREGAKEKQKRLGGFEERENTEIKMRERKEIKKI